MTVYVDEINEYANKPRGLNGKWCHLWADSPDELDRFAIRIGCSLAWAQDKQSVLRNPAGGRIRFYHYDLRPSMRTKALRAGAVEHNLTRWLHEQMRGGTP